MGLFDFFRKREKPVENKRSLIGGIPTRCTDWISASLTKVNTDIVDQQPIILPKCRYLAKNNPVVRAYLSMAEKNIIGKSGITLQSQMKSRDDSLDEGLNDKIEWAWYEWGKKSNGILTLDGQVGHNDLDSLILRTLLVDRRSLHPHT